MRPSLRQLEYALAVAEHLNFREAAKVCHVTQPALSAQVAQLEANLGVQLFERDRRKVIVTPVGAQILERARRILNQVDDLMESARVLQRPLVGTLRLGVIPTIAPYLLPRIIPAIQRSYPELRLWLREDPTELLVRGLNQGRLDLLLLALEAELGEVETLPLLHDEFLVAVSPVHPLAKRKEVRQEELRGEEVLLLDDGHCLRDQALEVCEQAGAYELGDFRASSLHTLAQMTAGGIGITLLPAIAVDTETRVENLLVRPFVRPAPARTIGLAWRRTSSREEEFRALAQLIQRAL